LLFLLGAVLAVAPIVLAEDTSQSLRLVTAPAPISLSAKPGETVHANLRIKNAGAVDEVLTATALPFGAYKDTGQPELRNAGVGDEYLKWMTFSPAVFTAHPGVWYDITATIAVPPEAAFGYYYAVVFSRSNTSAPPTGQTALEGGTAVLVLLNADVPGAKRTLEVTNFSVPSMSEFLPVTFDISVRNTGNVHAAVRGNIFLQKGNDKNVAILEVNPELGNILPNSSRAFPITWNDGTPYWMEKIANGKVLHNDKGDVERSLVWKGLDFSKLRMGHYTATLVMAYDDGTRDVPLEAKVSFWVIPWRLIVGVTLGPILLILLGYVFARRRIRRA
jgi:hypothetical protein